jgi:hypothetical protein
MTLVGRIARSSIKRDDLCSKHSERDVLVLALGFQSGVIDECTEFGTVESAAARSDPRLHTRLAIES